jgi:hypothetical protein
MWHPSNVTSFHLWTHGIYWLFKEIVLDSSSWVLRVGIDVTRGVHRKEVVSISGDTILSYPGTQ